MNAQELLAIADDELILGWRNSEWTGHRAVPRGGRRVLVDRAERDRPRAGALPARRRRARHDRGRARVRPQARGVPLLAVRRAARRPGLGADDRAPGALRGGGRETDQGADGVRRRTGRRPRREDRPRGGVPPDARADVARAAAGRAAYVEALEELRPLVDQRDGPRPEFEQLWEEMTEVRRSVPGATW